MPAAFMRVMVPLSFGPSVRSLVESSAHRARMNPVTPPARSAWGNDLASRVKAARRPGVLVAARASACLLGAASILSLTAGGEAVAQVPTDPLQAQTVATATYDIPAQSLASALTAFGRQSGLQVVFDPRTTAGKSTGGVTGTLTATQALQQLLAGTGVSYRFTSPGSVTVTGSPAGSGALQLDPVRVQGEDRSNPTLTEGTGSYIPRAVTVGAGIPTPMREIPQTVSVITQQQIQEQNLVSLPEVLQQTPGITVLNPSTNNFTFYSRGFQLTTAQQDGVALEYTNNQSYAPLDMAMYDHVEVLRGPGGLFTGAGQPSGTVNLVRKRPQNQFTLIGEASVGSFNFYRGVVDVGGPVNASGTIRGRVVASVQDNNYFYDVAHNRNALIYGTVEADIMPDTLLRFGMSYQKNDSIPFVGLPAYTNGQTLNVPRSSALGAVSWGSRPNETLNPFVELTHRLDNGWNLRLAGTYFHSTTNWTRTAASAGVDPNTNTIPSLLATYTFYGEDQFSIDSSASGPISLFGRTHEVIVGVNWRNELYNYWPGASVSIPGPFNVYAPVYNVPQPSILSPRANTVTNTTQYGLYLSGRFSLTDPLKLILGGRLNWYNASTQQLYPTVQSPLFFGDAAEFTPYAALVYDVAGNISAYASYTSIYQPQSYLTYNGALLNPVTGIQYEAGLKGSFFGGQLDGSLAFFLISQRNTAQADALHPGYYLPSGGEVESRGVDVQLVGRLVPGWNLTAGYTYNPTSYVQDATYQGQPYSTFTPQHMFKLWTDYEFLDGPLKSWSVGGGVFAVSTFSSSNIYQYGYGTLSARIGYKINEHLEAALNLNNLTDAVYYQTVTSPLYNNMYGAPFNAMFTLRGRL